MKNEIRFTLESKQRPKLAQEIGNILGTAPHYERVPSCAYDIAGYRLDMNITGGGGDVVVSGKSLVNHTHTGNLGNQTSPPT